MARPGSVPVCRRRAGAAWSGRLHQPAVPAAWISADRHLRRLLRLAASGRHDSLTAELSARLRLAADRNTDRAVTRRRPRGAGEPLRDSEGNRPPGCLLLVSRTWPGHRQRVRQQGPAHARRGAAASDERGARAVDYPGCDDARGGDARAHRFCHAYVSVVGCTPAMKHVSRRFAAVALVALALASCSRDPQKQAEKYVASGDAYIARKQFNQAAIEYKNAVKAKPERADIHYKLAKVYEAQADPGKAYQEYARTADLEPSNLDAQLQAGMLLLSAGEFEAARTRAELALKAAPDSAPANILL